MIGRDRELEIGGRFLKSIAGGAACLVFDGEAGIGKTTVWRELVGSARDSGYRVLSCQAAASEVTLSFAGLADLLSGVESSLLSELPSPQRHALEVALLESTPGPGPLEQRAVFAGFNSVLLRLAAKSDAPVLVAIDDLQWLDRPTQAALEFALRRAREEPIGFLYARRTGVDSTVVPGLDRALAESGAERAELGPLSVGALHQLILGRLGSALPRPTVVRIATAAKGNPFYALEIARDVLRREHHNAGEPLPVPDDLSQLVSERIGRLPPATREQLLLVAALASAPLELLDREALEPAEVAGLIEITGRAVSFSHPLFSAALYGSAPVVRRQELHRRLAGLVKDPEERARHLALGATETSEAIARALDRGAERATSRGAPDAAADLLELAAEMTPPDDRDRLAGREASAAESHFHAGDPSRARVLAERALARVRGGATRAGILRLLGELRYLDGSFTEAISLFEEALRHGPHGVAAAELHLNLAFAHSILGADPIAAEHSRAALEAATEAGDRALKAAALAMLVTREFRMGHALDRATLARALELEDPDRRMLLPMRPIRLAGIAEFYSDEFARAAALYGELRERVIDRGEDGQLPIVDAELSMAERTRGNLARALEIADEGCEIAQTLDSDTARADILCERSYVRAALGDEAGAREDAERALACDTDDGYAALWIGAARAFLELSLGNAQAANDALVPFRAAVEQAGSCNQFTAVMVPDQVEALVALGDLERADALTDMLADHASRTGRASALAAAARCRGLLAAARGDLETATAVLERALEALRRIEMPLELGRTLLLAGQVRRRAKQKRASREAFTRALEVFEAIGAGSWAARARAELERTGLRHRGGDELTPTESRVAELAAQGLTNRRIAETLFLSAKTVEANLARVYLKLGIRSRAELGAAMAQRPTVRAGS
jgi:DNA-binding CsgD family transcriptional regulator